MKNIPFLYATAKRSGSKQDINSYTEAVQYILANNPNEYISQIKHIIPSSIGLSTFKEFFEKYNIPIYAYDIIMESLENGRHQCKLKDIDSSEYDKSIEMMNLFKEQYNTCFNMYYYYSESEESDYSNGGCYKNNHSRRFSEYGPVSVPDSLINAHLSRMSSNDSTNKVNNITSMFLEDSYQSTPVFKEWLLEIFDNDIGGSNGYDCYKNLKEGSLSSAVDKLSIVKLSTIRESAITGNNNTDEIYTEDDIQDIRDLINFKEYMITCTESFEDASVIQNQIYYMCELFGPLLEEDVATSVIPNLPASRHTSSIIDESSLANTRNKKTGDTPAYLKRNHNLTYGEDDLNDLESSLDDFIRPSISEPQQVEPYNLDDDNDYMDTDNDDPDQTTSDERNKAISNYYYYTYKDSNNTTSNSHNQTNSHNKTDDRSTGKTSRDTNSTTNNYDSHQDSRKREDDDLIESILDFDNRYELFSESVSIILEEANSMIVYSKTQTDPSKFKEFVKKIKAVIDKLLQFIINTYDSIFPKTIYSFAKLLVKYRKSEAMTEYLKNTKNIITLLKLEIPNATGVNRALSHLKDYIITGKIPHESVEYYNDMRKTQLLIYYGPMSATGFRDTDSYDFYMSNSDKLNSTASNIEDTITVADHSDLMKAFGIIVLDENGTFWTFEKIRKLMKNISTKLKVDKFIKHGSIADEREGYDSLLNISKTLVECTKIVNETISKAYREAVKVLKQVESEYPKRNLRYQKVESTAPWELESPLLIESVGDADDNRPISDSPINDFMTDVDRKMVGKQQEFKRTVQNITNTGRTFIKPAKRTAMWINNTISQWKDLDETKMKERMADPHARGGIFKAVKTAIAGGSLFKAGILLNPVFIFLSITKGIGRNKKEGRIRNEMIGELKTEMEVLDLKISHAASMGDIKAQSQLTRLKNEINKKLIRVGSGTPGSRKKIAKMI